MTNGRKNSGLRIIKCASGELSEDELCEKYSGEYAVSKYAVTKPNLHRRLREINRQQGHLEADQAVQLRSCRSAC